MIFRSIYIYNFISVIIFVQYSIFNDIVSFFNEYQLLIPTNIIIHNVNDDITAVLPYVGGMILVVLSVILTLIGGIIPSKAAAKKDPVLALRSE